MKNEFQKHKTGDAIKWIAVAIAITLLAVSVAAALTQGFTNSNPYGWLDKECEHEFTDGVCAHCGEKEPAETTNPDEGLNVDIPSQESNAPIKLAYASASAENPFVKSLTATVYGDTTNKAVEWAISWYEGAENAGEDVQNFVKITPTATSTGSTLELQCLKGFGADKIMVTVTSVVGHFVADCTLTFDGAPSALLINTSGMTVTRDNAWGIDMVELNVGDTYNFDVSLDNAIHSVGSKYGNYTYTYEVFGTLYVDHEYRGSIKKTNVEVIARISPLAPYLPEMYYEEVNSNGTNDGCLQMYIDFLSASMSGSTLSVNPLTSVTIGARGVATGSDRGGRHYYIIKSYKENKVPYVRITVTDTVSGVSSSINVKNTCLVESVNLSASELVF